MPKIISKRLRGLSQKVVTAQPHRIRSSVLRHPAKQSSLILVNQNGHIVQEDSY